jgi:hypothetical protein
MSQVEEIFKQVASRRNNRRGRNFLTRNSTLMKLQTFSQSQSQSRVGSQLNSRIGSAKQTPRGLKKLPEKPDNSIKITQFFPAG